MPSLVDMNTPTAYWTCTGLVFSEMPKAIEHAINVLPNLALNQGTVMGEVTATPGTFGPYAGSTVGTPAAVTPTLTTATTGGSLAAGTYFVVFTYRNGVGETVKSTEASIVVPSGTSTNSITGTVPVALPSNAIGTNWYIGTVTATDYLVGASPTNTFLIQSLSTGTTIPPASTTAIAATNGQQNARCILRYPVLSDTNGNINQTTFGPSVTGIPVYNVGVTGVNYGPFGASQPSIDAIFGGVELSLGDIIGLDQAALTAGFGRIEDGVLGGPGRFLLT